TWQPLLRLMGSVEGIDQLLATRPEKTPEEQFDLSTSIMDLPKLLKTDLDTLPHEVPYLTPDPEGAEQWGQRIEGPGYKVGIVWAGAPTHGNDHNRSCHLRSFRELAQLDSIQLYSLQRGPAMEQIRELDSDFKMTPIGHLFKDLMDTACAMEHLDLIISVDTAVAHLAGALGKPVWTLLPHAPDWRWMLNRSDSPWYPSMRLFRQRRPAAWQALFSELLKHLKQTLGLASVSVPRKVTP
ncbi:MAG: glycosyltransferase family 9 protein, partial [Lysobacterales bacterium]